MPIRQPRSSKRFRRVNVDLGDLLGTAGLAAPSALAQQLEDRLGAPWEQLGHGDGLCLRGRVEEPAAAAGEAVGAFGTAPQPTTLLQSVVFGREPLPGEERSVATLRSATGTHAVHQQVLRGAPVEGALYKLHQDDNGYMAITGHPLGDLEQRDPGPLPAVPLAEVRQAIRRALELPDDLEIDLSPVVFPTGGQGVWAFKGECRLYDPVVADLRVFVRADDLELLLSYDVASSALYGEGNVFEVNPGRTPALSVVRLDRLGPDPSDRLSGALFDIRPKVGEPFINAVRDCRLEPDDPGFDQVNVYYSLTAAANWFGGLLGPELPQPPVTPMRVTVGDRSVRSAVAKFMPSTGEVLFGDNPRSGARSADICFHEYSHAVADRICRLSRSAGVQARALDEGFADYAQATSFGDPRFGDWVMDIDNGARNCADPALRFPARLAQRTDPYPIGAVWAAVLWDLRAAVGPGVADAVAFNSLYRLLPTSTLDDGRAALILADLALFPTPDGRGRHLDQIDAAFAGRQP
jgi:hypothetical protein